MITSPIKKREPKKIPPTQYQKMMMLCLTPLRDLVITARQPIEIADNKARDKPSVVLRSWSTYVVSSISSSTFLR